MNPPSQFVTAFSSTGATSTTSATQTRYTGTSETSAQILRGEYEGFEIETDPNSDSFIQEAAEEIGMAFADTMADKKKIQEQKIKGEKEVTTAAGKSQDESDEKTVEETAEFHLDVRGNQKPPEHFLKLYEKLKNLKNPDQEAILKQTAQDIADPTDQYIALQFVEEHGDTQANKVLSELAKEAKAKLMEEAGPRIRAGLNALGEAMKASKDGLAPLGQLRDFYRDVILAHEGILQTYNALREEYGYGKLMLATSFLIKAAGNDMSAQDSSIEKAQLKAIWDNLYQVQVLVNVYAQFAELLDRMGVNFQTFMAMDAEHLMETVLQLVFDTMVDSPQMANLALLLGCSTTRARIYFLTALYEQIRLIPLKVYPSLDQRDKLLKATQDALDLAIGEEEEEEAQEEGNEEEEENQ